MTSVTKVIPPAYVQKMSGWERDEALSLCEELEKGFRSIQCGEVYTIEEAWKEIDNI